MSSILSYFKRENPPDNNKRPHPQITEPSSNEPNPKKAKLTHQALSEVPDVSKSIRLSKNGKEEGNETDSLTEKLSSDEEKQAEVPKNAKSKVEKRSKTAVSTQAPKGKASRKTAVTTADTASVSPEEEKKKPKKKPRSKPAKASEGVKGELSGATFVFTGLMEGGSREEYEDRVKTLGGKVTTSVSKKTTYLVYGEVLEDGRNYTEGKKYLKALDLKTKILSQAEFNELIEKHEGQKESEEEVARGPSDPAKTVSWVPPQAKPNASSSLWTEKYAPTSLKDIIGNSSIVEKLLIWVQDWESTILRGEKKDLPPVRGGFFDPQKNLNARAALLSGPPGIGKTTAARLVAQALGYRTIELNASDARSKKALEPIKASSGNVALTNSGALVKTLVIMDEVDGMYGSDRGGVGALMEVIRQARVPIICICNDRNSQKLKSLVNMCYDLRFVRPTKQQIARRLMGIAEAEGLRIEENALDRLVDSSGNDIRQVFTMLEMWSRSRSTVSYMDMKSSESMFCKDSCAMISNFEAASLLLRRSEQAKRKHRERLNLFFIDFDLIPLLVQENYLTAMGDGDLENLSLACDSIAFGDTINQQIRQENDWSLLPAYGTASSIEPGFRSGAGVPFPRFPEWFGKNSSQKKNERLLRELRFAMAGFISGDNEDVLTDYVPLLFELLIHPLKVKGRDGVDEVLELMNTYNLTPEIFKEHLVELQFDSERRNAELKALPTQVKSTITRLFNTFNAGGTANKGKKRAVAISAEEKFDPDTQEQAEIRSSDTEEEVEEEVASTPGRQSKKKGKKPIKKPAN